MGDIVGSWQVALSDGIHKVEFEHGTTSGKRIVRVDNKEVLRHDWLFKLVGRETFKIGKHQCTIHIDAVSGFAYEYSLDVDGKPLEKFSENRSKISRAWTLKLDGVDYRVVLEKDTLDIWVNGQRIDAEAEFTDYGTETVFEISGHPAILKAVSSGHHRLGINHSLFVDGCEIPQANE
ncbi:unnamed protein product [Rotaria sordida]|uniref:Fas apoptotic inhibitory molecule 1 n=1 Tax=Rotaria sordida TaxID=392033 RepID=A0A813ZYH8_9BILA|nr:unnamed protein product [Rotaria sordida]CAF0898991.1 unnamed protein product [Rotaria sordida]CAF0904881.1 unnamed protein product [Rotaria sordida]CAF3493715.1 unnamed protein product [Rotaria sordida]